MDGLSLREKARLALRARMGVEIKQEMDKKDAELAKMRERLEKMEVFMASQMAAAEKPAPLKARSG